MEKLDIIDALENANIKLIDWFQKLDKNQWESGPEGKWTSGQQALHLLQSMTPLNRALSMPKFILRYKFGKSNRNVRDFDTVIKRYHERLQNVKGKTYGPSKNMKLPLFNEKENLLKRLQTENKKLQYKTLKKWNDKQLDTYILPHPLMGKMPVREIIMWTSHHIEQHLQTMQSTY